MCTSTQRIQRGISLIEALIAFLVLSLGVLGMSKLQSHLRLHSDIARQRSEAVRIAQEDMEALRSFASTTTARAWSSRRRPSSAEPLTITERSERLRSIASMRAATNPLPATTKTAVERSRSLSREGRRRRSATLTPVRRARSE